MPWLARFSITRKPKRRAVASIAAPMRLIGWPARATFIASASAVRAAWHRRVSRAEADGSTRVPPVSAK